MKTILQKIGMLMGVLLGSLSSYAYDFEVDGIQYDITSFSDLTVCASSLASSESANLVIPETVEFNGKSLKVTSLGDSFAADNAVLESVIINVGIETISSNAFYNCSSLKTVNIPHVIAISSGAFEKCVQLKDIIISGNLNSIGERAFLGCGVLEKIILPNSLTMLGEAAFQDCSMLNDIDISNVSIIHPSTFSGCRVLSKVKMSEGFFFNLVEKSIVKD